MIKYKINVYDALERAGHTTYTLQRKSGLSADVIQKIKNNDSNISIKSLDKICALLDMQPKDIIFYIEEPAEKEK